MKTIRFFEQKIDQNFFIAHVQNDVEWGRELMVKLQTDLTKESNIVVFQYEQCMPVNSYVLHGYLCTYMHPKWHEEELTKENFEQFKADLLNCAQIEDQLNAEIKEFKQSKN